MSSNWFPTKVYCFHECLLTQFWLFASNISVRTDREHQGNRYPAARNSASPPETFTQQLNTPGTVTILQGANCSPWSTKGVNKKNSSIFFCVSSLALRQSYSISQEICTRFCCALLCCGYAIVHNEFTLSIYPYLSGLLCWHWGNR